MPGANLDLQEALRALFPSMTAAELQEAAGNLSAYLGDVSLLYDALVADPARYASFKELTAEEERATVKDGVVGPATKEQTS